MNERRGLKIKGKKTKLGSIILVTLFILVSTASVSYSSKTNIQEEEFSNVEFYNLTFIIIELWSRLDKNSTVKISYLGFTEYETASNLRRLFYLEIEICKFHSLPEGTYISWEVKKEGCTTRRGNLILEHDALKLVLMWPEL